MNNTWNNSVRKQQFVAKIGIIQLQNDGTITYLSGICFNIGELSLAATRTVCWGCLSSAQRDSRFFVIVVRISAV